jgi:hypothetical protein
MTFVQSLANYSHCRENLNCIIVEDFYSSLIYMENAPDLLADLTSSIQHVDNKNIPFLMEVHSNWLNSFDYNKDCWVRLFRHIHSNYFIVIVNKNVIGFNSKFKKLKFEFLLPAKGPGEYYLCLSCKSDEGKAVELNGFAAKRFLRRKSTEYSNISMTHQMKKFSDFFECYFQFDIANDV